MKTIILLFIIFIPFAVPAQDNTGIIYPAASFFNQTRDTLFYMPKHKLEILIEREELNKELFIAFTKREAICDSTLQLKSNEAENWYLKLIETGNQLKEAEIASARRGTPE